MCITILVVFICGLLLIRSRRRKSKALPNVPWVGRDRRQWFSKLRARTWTTVNYESALREVYENVRALVLGQGNEKAERTLVLE